MAKCKTKSLIFNLCKLCALTNIPETTLIEKFSIKAGQELGAILESYDHMDKTELAAKSILEGHEDKECKPLIINRK